MNGTPGQPNFFQGEDEPFYKHAYVVLYTLEPEMHFYICKDTQEPISATIQERDGSIMFTIARALLTQTCHFVPTESLDFMAAFNGYPLFANPAINAIIQSLYEDDGVVIDISGDTWTVFYPLKNRIQNLEALNNRLKGIEGGAELVEDAGYAQWVKNFKMEKAESKLEQRVAEVQSGEYQFKPYYGFILQEDQQDWQHIYQGLFMGNLSVDWERRWKVYLAYKHEIPSNEDLKTIKALVFPGSARAVYDESNLFVPVVSEFIRKVIDLLPHIKLFGSCFGHQIFAHALFGQVVQMNDISPDRVKIIGREHIKLTEDFFGLPYVIKYMEKKGLTKEAFPKIVLQQSHGDHVIELPQKAVLLGSSDTCNIEMFAIGTRLFCMQAHPDFNQSVQEEINEGEYVLGKMIHDQSHQLSWAISGQRFFPDKSEMRETRNLVHALTREFFEFQ